MAQTMCGPWTREYQLTCNNSHINYDPQNIMITNMANVSMVDNVKLYFPAWIFTCMAVNTIGRLLDIPENISNEACVYTYVCTVPRLRPWLDSS